jgi:hypothetical protein
MGCKGCPEKNKNLSFDKYGNPVIEGSPPNDTPTPNKDSAMGDYEKEVYEQTLLKGRKDITYKEYVAGKAIHRDRGRALGDNVIKNLSDDYKRIQIDELVGVVNSEEVHRLSPTQALVMLHELVHHKDYQKIIVEFTNLSEQVDTKYAELVKNKITTFWEPK